MPEKYYLKLDGIEGDVKEKGYEKTIPVLEFRFEKIGDARINDPWNTPDRVVEIALYGNRQLTLLLPNGIYSPRVFQAVSIGEPVKRAILYVVRTGKKPARIRTFTLRAVRLARLRYLDNSQELGLQYVVLQTSRP